MRVMGFTFTKISIETFKEEYKDLKINTEIDFPEIKEVKQSILKTKEDILEVYFEYKVKYNPEIAIVEFKGKTLLALDPKLAKDVLKQWKKKKMPEEFRLFLFNVILRKATPKAIGLEDEINVPIHMPMPSFRRQEEK